MEPLEINGDGLECKLQFSIPDVEGLMKTTIKIVTPSLKGGFSCTVYINELKSFVDELSALNNAIGKKFGITWGNVGENIEFTFNLSKLGKLTGSYKFSPNNFSLGPTLSGDFKADQTVINSWLIQAEEIVANASENRAS